MKYNKRSRKLKGGWLLNRLFRPSDEESWFSRTRKRIFSRNPEIKEKLRNKTVPQPRYKNIDSPTCAVAQNCLLFGFQIEEMLYYFNSFHLDRSRDSPVKLLWSHFPVPSHKHSVLYKVAFTRENFTAYTMLKTSLDHDNLMYEYFVGKYLNMMSNYLPTFVHTYGIYHDTPDEKGIKMLPNRPKSTTPTQFPEIPEMKKTMVPDEPAAPTIIIKSPYTVCSASNQDLLLLIQYLDGSKPLSYYWLRLFERDMMAIMYQIYYALDCMHDEFKHNDLHQNNVLVYKLPKPIKYIYEIDFFSAEMMGRKEVTFTSEYLVKIIDYGRCKFPESDELIKFEGVNCRYNGLSHIATEISNSHRPDENLFLEYTGIKYLRAGKKSILEYAASKLNVNSASLFGTLTVNGYMIADYPNAPTYPKTTNRFNGQQRKSMQFVSHMPSFFEQLEEKDENVSTNPYNPDMEIPERQIPAKLQPPIELGTPSSPTTSPKPAPNASLDRPVPLTYLQIRNKHPSRASTASRGSEGKLSRPNKEPPKWK